MVVSNKKKEFLKNSKLNFYYEINKYKSTLKPTKEIEGFASYVIVGEKNYPNLATHNISNDSIASSYRNSSDIVKKKYDDIFKIKARNILGSTNPVHVKNTSQRIQDEIRDIYKAKNIVNFSSNFSKELTFDKVVVNKIAGIAGSKNDLISLNSTENTQTSKQVEKYIENDIKAKEAVISLYEKGVNEHQIINLLALGSFGVSVNKKLVPSKWAISAYDQTIEKYLHKKILKFSSLNEYELYSYSDKGNFFLIILFPDTFAGNVIETFPGAVEEDFVLVDNKLKKPEPETAGGFYATKIAIHEFLVSRKKQASYLSIRIIKDYEIPLGVVFVRECVRNALNKKILFKTSNKKDLESYLYENFKEHFEFYLKSQILKNQRIEKKVTDFFI